MVNNYLQKIMPKYEGYQDLHVHSEASYRDGVNTVNDIFDAAQEMNRSAVAITDHGNMLRLFDALKERSKREKKALIKYLQALYKLTEKESTSIANSIIPKGSFESIRNPSEKMYDYINKYEDAFVAAVKNTVQFIPGIEMYEAPNKISIERKAVYHTLCENGVDKDKAKNLASMLTNNNDLSNPIPEFINGVSEFPDILAEFNKEILKIDKYRYHIILYGKDWTGMQTIFKICNLAQLNKYNDMPRLTLDTLSRFIGPGTSGHGHVVGTSACMAGKLSNILLTEFNLKESIRKEQEKLDKLSLIPDETFKTLNEHTAELESQIQELKINIANQKSLAGKKIEKKIESIKNKIDVAEKKVLADSQRITMFETPSSKYDIVLEDLQRKYNELMKTKKMIETAKESLPKLQEEMQKVKMAVSTNKENLQSLKKINAPADKNIQNIQGFQQKINALPDLYEKAKAAARAYNEIFGEGNFFIELQNHGILEETITLPKLVSIARELNIPVTTANDVHYKNPEMKRKRDIIASLRFNTPIEETANHHGNDQLYFKTNEQMAELFPTIPEALNGPSKIAEMCNVYYKKDMHLPTFTDEEQGRSPKEYLKDFSCSKVKTRYPDYDNWTKERQLEFKKRLRYELDIIEKMGYSSYISIVEDFINYSKSTFSPESVGPGRGSGAGSLVCYLTGITNIDPLKYGLIFERFLNPDRVSMPDIDTDFATSIRDKVVLYVSQKYAYKKEYDLPELRDTVCNISTEGKLAAKSAIRSASRVTHQDDRLSSKLAKLVPTDVGMTLETAIKTVKELQAAYDEDPKARQLLDDALLIENTPVQAGVHAAGVIIADKPISDYAPMFWNEAKECWVIQCDMIACESDLGLLKMDFLGLKNLDIIMMAKRYVKLTKNQVIDFQKVNNADDKEIINKIYAKGNTDGIFQFESGGMKQTLQSFAPTTIDDIILLNAAYRPGPMQFIPEVTEVRFKRKAPDYIIPEMAEILDATYGKPIYQEQIQQLFHKIAGFSLSQADIIRRAMSKKHLDEIEAAKDQFFDGFTSKGGNIKAVESFWTELLDFAKYAFNKSHAAAYSVVSYYTAFLKYYYPVEYMSALISHTANDKLGKYINNAKEMGIKIVGPSVNRSIKFTAPTKTGIIRMGLGSVKGVASSAEDIIAERNENGTFTSFMNFMVRMTIGYGISKTAVESLIGVGALDDILENRTEAINNVPEIGLKIKDAVKKQEKLSKTLNMEIIQQEIEALNFPKFQEADKSILLKTEKDLIGFYVSGHPLDQHKDKLKKFANMTVADADEDGKIATFAGSITNAKVLYRKKDNAPMCKFDFEDLTGSMSAICFTQVYKSRKPLFEDGNIVSLSGRIEIEYDDDKAEILSKQMIVSNAVLIS